MKTSRFKKALHRVCFPITGVFVIACSSCVYDKEFAYLNDQVVALNRRTSQLEDASERKIRSEVGGVRSEVGGVRTTQAEMRAEMDRIREDMKKISGRIEDNEHVIKRAVERDLGDQDSLKTNLNQLSQKVAELEKAVKQQQAYLGMTDAPPPEEGKEPPPMAPAGAPQPPKVATEGELYDSSLNLYKEGKYESAIDGFKDFLKKYPKSDRADNAQYWVGECYMALKQWDQAILAYQQVVSKYPKGNKVPNALMRQGLAFIEIKDKTSAKLLFEKVIKNYPSSSEAAVAKKKLEGLR